MRNLFQCSGSLFIVALLVIEVKNHTCMKLAQSQSLARHGAGASPNEQSPNHRAILFVLAESGKHIIGTMVLYLGVHYTKLRFEPDVVFWGWSFDCRGA